MCDAECQEQRKGWEQWSSNNVWRRDVKSRGWVVTLIDCDSKVYEVIDDSVRVDRRADSTRRPHISQPVVLRGFFRY